MDKKDQPIYIMLRDLASTNRPKSYLEIGVRDGDSLLAVLAACSVKRLVLCDTWGDLYGGTARGGPGHITKLMMGYSVPVDIQYLNGDSKELVPDLDEEFDLITVDGDHSFLGCLTDMENSWKLLAVGGSMVVDDLMHPAHLYIEDCVRGFVKAHADCKLGGGSMEGHGVAVLLKEALPKEE